MNRKRKAHAKSRGGCQQCKGRHIKCNEAYPQCLNCKRHDLSCSFSVPCLTTTPLNDDSLADLELLDFWHRNSIQANTSVPAGRWEHDAVRLGFSHHYLLNSILAIAALQLFDKDRSQKKWYVRAVAHRQAAITRARPHFQHLEESHHLALLNFSYYNSIYALAEPPLRPAPAGCHQSPFDPVNELLQAIRLGRCSALFVQQHLGFLPYSDPHLVAKYRPRLAETPPRREPISPQLAWLQQSIENQCDGRERDVCLHAAESLFASIACVVNNPGDQTQTQAIWGWASNVDSTFLDMCYAQDTAALVILAHFAALLHLGGGCIGRSNWCLQGWPTALLRHIRGLLKDELEETIRWPEQVVFGDRLVLPPAA